MSSSSFALLEDEDLLTQQLIFNQHKKKPNKTRKHIPIEDDQTGVSETEFSKLHINEIWVVILSFFDMKTLYRSYLLIDKKVYKIINSVPVQKFHLQTTFSGIISGMEEQDHLPLLNHGTMTLSKRIQKIFTESDPSNIFGFINTSEPIEKSAVSVEDSTFIFRNLFIGLLNRRLNIMNRNIKLRGFLGLGNCVDCPGCSNRKNTKQAQCEHFRIEVTYDETSNYLLKLKCKSCLHREIIQLTTVLGKLKEFC